LLSGLRFWGWEFDYDGSVACIRRGGIVPRKGSSARKNQDPVASTSNQIEEPEFLDYELDGEAGGEGMPDEPFDADWSRNFMCVADPFIVTKVRSHPTSRSYPLSTHFFQNCAGQIYKFIFTRFIHECRNTEGMLRIGISLESVLSRELPAWRNPASRPIKFKGKKKQTNKNKDRQVEGKGAAAEKPKAQSQPGSSHSKVLLGGSNNPHRNGRGGKRGAPTRIQANNP
jgi:hypothetical protein